MMKIFHIKDSMYSVDFWIYDKLLDEFAELEMKKNILIQIFYEF